MTKPTLLFVCTHNAGRSALGTATVVISMKPGLDLPQVDGDPTIARSTRVLWLWLELGIGAMVGGGLRGSSRRHP